MYDFLIVGAGAAGAAMAARLTDGTDKTVLLLESGPDYLSADQPDEMASPNPFNLLLPRRFQEQYMYPDLMARRTARQEHRIYWRGKGVGGSTAVNGQIAIRGLLHAFDRWESDAGCTGWGREGVLPFFNLLEDDPLEAPYHGQGGPIPIFRMPQDNWGAVDRALRDAALEAGHPWNDDLNAPDTEGVSCYPINNRDARRVSTNDSYLETARRRNNFSIRCGVTVDRVLLDGRRATGVRASVNGEPEEFHADTVILSAGSIHTPPILQRSGIGRPETLKAHGIAPVADLPVGEDFFDHPFCRFELKLKDEHRARDVNARHTNACVRMSTGVEGAQADDILYVAMNHGGVGVESDSDSAQFGAAMVNNILMDCASRGSVTLSSADPFMQPVVEENMLDDETDRAQFRAGYRHLGSLVALDPIQSICDDVTLGDSDLPLGWLDDASEDELDDFLLEQSSDAQHGIGGCRMSGNGSGVVDPFCRVEGFQGLRVVDASIMPLDCQANTNLTSIMIGEKMARAILDGH